jgi:hypothetical protein
MILDWLLYGFAGGYILYNLVEWENMVNNRSIETLPDMLLIYAMSILCGYVTLAFALMSVVVVVGANYIDKISDYLVRKGIL